MTDPLEVRQPVDSSAGIARRPTDSLPPEQEEMLHTDPFLPRIRTSRNRASFSGENEYAEEENTPSLLDYLSFLGRSVWELLQSIPPGPRLACLFLCLAALIVLFSLLNALQQILGPVANAMYICTGTVASIIAIHEALDKSKRR